MSMNDITVGTITRGERVYEIDWPVTIETAELPKEKWQREYYAAVYRDGKQLTDFVNPNWDMDGWETVDDLMELANEVVDHLEQGERS